MLNTLKADLYKFFKSKTFYVILGISLFFAMLTIIASYFYLKQVVEAEGHMSPDMISSGRDALINSLKNPMIIMLVAVMTSIFVARSYSSGVIKDTVSSGRSRNIIYLSKFIVSSMASLLVILITFIVQGTFGTIMLGYGQAFAISDIWLFLETFSYVAIIILAINSMFVFFATWFKSLGGSLGVNIGVTMFGGLIFALISLIHSAVAKIENYWIINHINPVVNKALGFPVLDMPNIIILSAVYLIGFIALGLLVFKKQDI